jgi:hypothetical protein
VREHHARQDVACLLGLEAMEWHAV